MYAVTSTTGSFGYFSLILIAVFSPSIPCILMSRNNSWHASKADCSSHNCSPESYSVIVKFIFFIPVFDCSHAYKPYKSHLALFIISNKSFTRSFSASNDYFPHRTTISYRNAEALYLKLFEIQCFPAFSISSC